MVTQVVNLSFKMSLRWFDPRLIFYNLNEDKNFIDKDLSNQIWTPIITVSMFLDDRKTVII